MIWRAGPAGGPAGGAGVSGIAFTTQGLHERPWSPAHLRAGTRADGGFDLGWIPRSRIDGDRWDGETAASGAMRFRVRVLDGDTAVRVFGVEPLERKALSRNCRRTIKGSEASLWMLTMLRAESSKANSVRRMRPR